MSAAPFYIASTTLESLAQVEPIDRRVQADRRTGERRLSERRSQFDQLEDAARSHSPKRFTGELPSGWGNLPARDASDADRAFMSVEAIEARRDNDRLGFRG